MRNKDIYLSVIGVLILVLTMVGISYAYLSAQAVSGNIATNNIATTVAKYGTLTVSYHGTNGVISLGAIDLPETTAGTPVKAVMKFTVGVDNTQTVDTSYNVAWAGTARVTNTFCQYANTTTQTCTNVSTDTYVGNEITYTLYNCNSLENYNATTTTSFTGCSVAKAETAAPYSTEERSANIVSNKLMDISAGRTHWYVMLLTIYNKTTPQDYNQGKTFVGAVTIVPLTN